MRECVWHRRACLSVTECLVVARARPHCGFQAECETLSWHSEKKKTSEAAVRLRDCELRLGQHTAVFKRYAARGVVFEGMSFSLESRGGGGRTLDVACKDKQVGWVGGGGCSGGEGGGGRMNVAHVPCEPRDE